jgi:hypothetical protein
VQPGGDVAIWQSGNLQSGNLAISQPDKGASGRWPPVGKTSGAPEQIPNNRCCPADLPLTCGVNNDPLGQADYTGRLTVNEGRPAAWSVRR